jgi:hypothetical protein
MGAWRLPAVAVLAISVALGLSACGGDNDPAGEPPTTSPPEANETAPKSPAEQSFPADFQQKVDPVCAKAQAQIDKIAATNLRDQASLKKLAGVYAGAASDLEALKPPAQNASAYKQFTDAFRNGQDLVTRLNGEVSRGDSSAYQRVPTILDEVNTEVKDQASQYGFKGCISD